MKDPVFEKFEIGEILVKSCGWTWWHENVLAISDRPCVLNRDERGRLHSLSGPSIAYRDEWKLYHVHGVAVPEYVIERPSEITGDDIEAEKNAEVRRVKIDQFSGGKARYIKESGAKILHKDDWGILYQKDLSGDEPLVMVEVVNSTAEPDGSFKNYFLRVDPQLRPLPSGAWSQEKKQEWLQKQKPQQLTARNAVASTFGMRGEDYKMEIQT